MSTQRRPSVIPAPFRDPGDIPELLAGLATAAADGTITELAVCGVGPDGRTVVQIATGRPQPHPMALLGAVAMLRRQIEDMLNEDLLGDEGADPDAVG